MERITGPTLGVPSLHFGMSSRKSFQNCLNDEIVTSLGVLCLSSGRISEKRVAWVCYWPQGVKCWRKS